MVGSLDLEKAMSSVKEIVKKMRERIEFRKRHTHRFDDLEEFAGELEDCQYQHGVKLSAIVGWLEKNQPDVFRRGLWDVISQDAPAGAAPPPWAKPEWVEWTYNQETGEFERAPLPNSHTYHYTPDPAPAPAREWNPYIDACLCCGVGCNRCCART